LEDDYINKPKLYVCTFFIMFRWPCKITFDLDKLLITVMKETQWAKKCHLTKKKELFGYKRNKLASRGKTSAIINPSLQLLR